MKLLVLTQKVDKNDPILGFFHGWLEELAKNCESLIVICLEKGEYDLPDNVRVLSLGKEVRHSKVRYIVLFYKYIWQERNNYDAVFVHMNQEYVLLAGGLWRMMGKKVYMWRNHHQGNLLTDMAVLLCDKVFCTSQFSYTAKYKKTKLMPVGIDTKIFKINPGAERVDNSILFIGRISPSKRVHLLIEALGELKKKYKFHASIVGNPLSTDASYYDEIKNRVQVLGLEGVVKFVPGVPNIETVNIYNAHEICVNLSSSGMYDKTIFEAALCGTLPLSSNQNLKKVVNPMLLFKELDMEDLVLKLEGLISLSKSEKILMTDDFSKFIHNNHSLEKLGENLMGGFK